MEKNKNTNKIILIIFSALLLLAGSFSGGVLVGWLIPEKTDQQTIASQSADSPGGTPSDLTTLFAPFWESWQYVHDQYVEQPVDDTALMQGAIQGMLESLGDQHTSYMNPEQYKEASIPLDGSYEGIGAYVDTAGDYLTIISPMPESPAEKAGLRPGDMVIKVNGDDVTGINPTIVLKSVKGPAGTDVTLTIARENDEQPFDVTITRQKIELPSVTSEMMEGNIGYIYLSTFGETTTQELKAAINDLMAQNPQGIILDLRYNGGGYLITAVEVISQFISEGTVLIEQQGNGQEIVYSAEPGGLATEIPLVVLVNEGSASASEITAGAIQDYGRGTLVGVTTYGKGSVQNWIALAQDQGAVRITIARWLTPNRHQINEMGLTPDVIVPITEEDIEANIDPQLNKALEILRQSQ